MPDRSRGDRSPGDRRGSSGCFAGTPGATWRRHFHAVRVSRDGRYRNCPTPPVVVVLNHPSWWDPLIALILTEFLPVGRDHYAPIEAAGLAQYRFLSRLGFFGFDPGTSAGAARFLRTSLAILGRPESVLWITAQGEFVDPRERPTSLKAGIGHLAHRLGDAIIVPLAIEYPFWNDRCPEVLVRFGSSDRRSETAAADLPAIGPRAIERSLEDELDALAIEAMGRDPAHSRPLIEGTAGVGGVYDTWRRTRAWLGGRTLPSPSMRRVPRPATSNRPLVRPTHGPDRRNPTE